MTNYSWFSEIQRAMNSSSTDDDFQARINALISQMSALVEAETGRRFDHRFEDVYHNCRRISNHGDVSEDGSALLLKEDSQSISQIYLDSLLLDPSNYVVLPQTLPAHRPFKDRVLLTNYNLYWGNSTVRPEISIKVSGIWGYGGAWKRLTDLSDDLDSTDETPTLASTSGLESGKILRVDEEYLEVTSVASGLSVSRQVNGSIAAQHLSGTSVYVFYPYPPVVRLINRLVLWASSLDDSPIFGTVTLGEFSQNVDLSSAPKDCQAWISLLKRKDDLH